MADIISPWWSDVKTVVAATWTDILPANGGGGIAQVISFEKVDWEAISVPYAPVMFAANEWPGSAITCEVMEVIADLFYIKLDTTNTAAAIRTKLAALDDALYAATMTAGVSFLDVIGYDLSEHNPAMEVLLALNLPYSAGSIRTRWLVGETYL